MMAKVFDILSNFGQHVHSVTDEHSAKTALAAAIAMTIIVETKAKAVNREIHNRELKEAV